MKVEAKRIREIASISVSIESKRRSKSKLPNILLKKIWKPDEIIEDIAKAHAANLNSLCRFLKKANEIAKRRSERWPIRKNDVTNGLISTAFPRL